VDEYATFGEEVQFKHIIQMVIFRGA
jgi:hypothetical protein